jgi:hypothetical protein
MEITGGNIDSFSLHIAPIADTPAERPRKLFPMGFIVKTNKVMESSPANPATADPIAAGPFPDTDQA